MSLLLADSGRDRPRDSACLSNPELLTLKGQLYIHNDEAGRLTYTDRLGQAGFYRQVITDNALTAYQKCIKLEQINPVHHSYTTKNS